MRNFGSPFLIISVALLLTNDWILKHTFHNSLTGKLSDFAGLFAFAFFMGSVFPKAIKVVHVLIAILFLAWKSELSQPLIELFHAIRIPINRTIDYSDSIALLVLPLSYMVLKHKPIGNAKLVLSRVVLVFSCFAFMATSMVPRKLATFRSIDRTYYCKCSRTDLLNQYNRLQLKNMLKNNYYGVRFDSKTNMFHSNYYHYNNTDSIVDTLAVMVDDEVVKTMDTVHLKTSFSEVKISGNGAASSLSLLTVGRVVLVHKKKDYRRKAIKEFERRVTKKMPCARQH